MRKPAKSVPDLDLAACPFCASTDLATYEYVYAKHFTVTCVQCGAEGPRRQTPREAGWSWNRRAQD